VNQATIEPAARDRQSVTKTLKNSRPQMKMCFAGLCQFDMHEEFT
jgi:hypothetical protein